MERKAVELSINVLIVAVVALLVLVVLVYILVQGTDNTVDSLACVKLGGVCKPDCNTAPYTTRLADGDTACQTGGATDVCCALAR